MHCSALICRRARATECHDNGSSGRTVVPMSGYYCPLRRSTMVFDRARHADPRTTMRYDRARKNLDRHPNYILAAYMASGT
jgi:hypothetical protein